MKFDALDKQMRAFETSLDQHCPSEGFLVARLDGRGFTKLTKSTLAYERPFDARFHTAMVKTCESLMTSGFRFGLCYTQSDEISLLFAPDENAFDRKTRKLNSILAGVASGVFSLEVERPVSFDCRLCPLPEVSDAIDYFRWRAEDARRNALSAWCHWTLIAQGATAREADQRLKGLTPEEKRELLVKLEVDIDNEPDWKRFGEFLEWRAAPHPGLNPITGEEVAATRRRLSWRTPTPQGNDIAVLVEQVLSRGQ